VLRVHCFFIQNRLQWSHTAQSSVVVRTGYIPGNDLACRNHV